MCFVPTMLVHGIVYEYLCTIHGAYKLQNNFMEKIISLGLLSGAAAYLVPTETNALDVPLRHKSCTAPDNAKICEDACMDQAHTCRQECQTEECDAECVRQGFFCCEICPCHGSCPLGCDDCNSWACGSCIGSDSEKCNNDTILVVYHKMAGPVLLQQDDTLVEIPQFTFEDGTGSDHSCSIVINGRMILFGGYDHDPYKNQISEVEYCRLRRIGDLPMEFSNGGCATLTAGIAQESGLLCFAWGATTECHRQVFTIYISGIEQ